jgi:hypothetical protein
MDSAVQGLLTTIEQLSAAGSLKELKTHLQAQEELLIKHLPQLDEILAVLQPLHHTMGMLFILCDRPACAPPAARAYARARAERCHRRTRLRRTGTARRPRCR